ncbi:hypothetical protein [Aequorivita sp. CIP111184]|uniref:hypothetical protein n=1 Tax=Aequorivita sp. CIP111184 TaxID=2211356 RepID=UPI000DBC2397|nr:hypothetical protein [Aequorivita sp. CIP111184]SRX54826.1 hypothetical protein AEQU1_01844 [Aequorivita sp. CIP111184]
MKYSIDQENWKGLSIPEATLLKKVMSLKLMAIFFGIVTLAIIISGFIFNVLL